MLAVSLRARKCHRKSTDLALALVIDANGLKLGNPIDHEPSNSTLALHLEIKAQSSFTLTSLANTGEDFIANCRKKDIRSPPLAEFTTSPPPSQNSASGVLKPLPQVSGIDAAWFDCMIAENLVPYPKTDDFPGRSKDEIRALGQRLFPFSPYHFQLAMAVYDWTTASFTRMVLFNMFRYTALDLQRTAPIDQQSIARAIWTSNWGPFTAQDPHFMGSFMMRPAWSQLEVELQLLDVRAKVEKAVEVENRLLSAAMQSLPRISITSKPQLFSGQLDMSQLDIDDFGISFMECPSNKGPICQPLKDNLGKAISTYLTEGRTITTKVTWSFTDSLEGAMHYSNGIIIVVNFPDASRVWETASYITPLSADPQKTEYTFPPGSRFEVHSVDEIILMKQQVLAIILQPRVHSLLSNVELRSGSDFDEVLPSRLEKSEDLHLIEKDTFSLEPPHSRNKTGGRRCDCINWPSKASFTDDVE